jgi:hypothetical protein
MPSQIPQRKTDSEVRVLRCILAGAGCVIVASALCHNAGSVLLALGVCLACASRMERSYRRGAYGRVEIEVVE